MSFCFSLRRRGPVIGRLTQRTRVRECLRSDQDDRVLRVLRTEKETVVDLRDNPKSGDFTSFNRTTRTVGWVTDRVVQSVRGGAGTHRS